MRSALRRHDRPSPGVTFLSPIGGSPRMGLSGARAHPSDLWSVSWHHLHAFPLPLLCARNVTANNELFTLAHSKSAADATC